MALKFAVLPTNERAMRLNVSEAVFIDEFKKCWQNKNSELTNLLDMVRPFLLDWERYITRTNLNLNIGFVSCCRMLSKDMDEALRKIKVWREWAENTSSILEELEILFIELVRTLKYLPAQASPRMTEFAIAQNFKFKLKDSIVYINGQPGHEILFNKNKCGYETLVYSIEYPDFFLFKNLNVDKWQAYLLELVCEGYNTSEMARIIKLPRETFYYEERDIWKQLNKN